METLLTDLDEGILTITVNRPEKMNALNSTVLKELESVLDEIYSSEKIHAAIITGAGPKAFVAGADISEFMSLTAEQGMQLARKGQDLFFKIENCAKPIVAAVNGFALGGGCELAMSCHFRIASDHAKFGQPEVNLGIIPGYGGTQRMTHLVGKGLAMEWILSGRMIDSTEALQHGLVNRVTEIEQLLTETKKTLHVILAKSPMAVGKAIEAINASQSPDGYQTEVKAFGECFDKPEMKEGVSAFMEKRKPEFRKSNQ
ncbi:MAG: enoyl-CoA hydratase/isomerase family protein [Chitinophagaceae bacterium]